MKHKNKHIHFVIQNVDYYFVSIFHQSNWSAILSFRSDVANYKAVGSSGESSVGD